MDKIIQLSDRIKIIDSTIHKRQNTMMVKFDDPPGPSPARCTLSILHGQEDIQNQLSNDLKGNVKNVAIGGVYSHAFTDETYAILIFALGGVAGGGLGAIGQDIWNAIKTSCQNIFQRKSAKRNILEVALHFEGVDVLLHYENRSALSLPEVLNNADSILKELSLVLRDKTSSLKQAKTIELRQIKGEDNFECVLHSYRKSETIIRNLTKTSSKTKKTIEGSKKQRKSKSAEQGNSPNEK